MLLGGILPAFPQFLLLVLVVLLVDGFGGVNDALVDVFEEEGVEEGIRDGIFQLVDCSVIKIFLKTNIPR